MTRSRPWRIAICALSVVLLTILGDLGEASINLFYAACPKGQLLENVPVVTGWVVKLFPINSGHFVASLSPFAIIFLALAAARPAGPGKDDWFLAGFIATWLVALIYMGLFALVLLMPFHLLMISIEGTPLGYIVAVMDVVLIFVAGAFIFRTYRRREDEER